VSPAVVSFVAGVIFAIGLGVAGMTQPAKVFAFLDLFGRWDPSLAFVMGGAIGVHAIAYRLIVGRSKPVLEPRYAVPASNGIDGKLVGGAALFGAGWGLAGYCPGPAVTSLASGDLAPLDVVTAMLAGMMLHRVLASGGAAASVATPRAATPEIGAMSAVDG